MFGPLLWEKASLQGENGVFTLIKGQVIQHDRLTYEELEDLRKIRGEIEKVAENNKNIRGFEPKQFLISVHCWSEEPLIAEIVKKIDVENKFYIKWNSEAYDIFPRQIGRAHV